jgi:hypothetical protein
MTAKTGMSTSGVPPRSRPTRVGDDVCRRADSDSQQARGEGTPSGKEDRQDQHDAEPDLEGTDVLDEVLVIRLEGSRRLEESPRGDHGPHPEGQEGQPAEDGDRSRERPSVHSWAAGWRLLRWSHGPGPHSVTSQPRIWATVVAFGLRAGSRLAQASAMTAAKSSTTHRARAACHSGCADEKANSVAQRG